MRKTAVIVLADGFEEVEAVTPIDVLRRAGIEVIIAGAGKTEIKSSRGMRILADIKLEDYQSVPDAIILPGGIPGADNLHQSAALGTLLEKTQRQGKIIAAICASPAVVLAPRGFLEGKKVTGYPGYEAELGVKSIFVDQSVVRDGNLITSRGPGTAFEFSLELVRMLTDETMAAKVASAMLVKL